jgi:phage regulator Rha-like protein
MKEIVPVETITGKIHFIREHKVILDRDLAELYGVETGQLKRGVRRNIDRFPSDFMFVLSKEENDSLRSQFGILKRGEHSKYPPMAFTEQGVAMLSSVLGSKRAVQVNIAIMRAFVQMREMLAGHKQFAQRLEELEKRLTDHDDNFQIVFEAIKQLLADDEKPKKKIGF